MSESNLANSTVLEIGEISGVKTVSNNVQIGTDTTRVYHGCKPTNQPDQMFNPSDDFPDVRVVGYSGNYVGYWFGIGSTSSGCSQTQIQVDLNNGIEYQPLNNSKLLLIDMYNVAFYRQEPDTFNNKHFRPNNSLGLSEVGDGNWNVQGRTLYIKSVDENGLEVTLCFDVVDSYGTYLICKGNGGDHISDYIHLNRNWYNNQTLNGYQGNLEWYISAYVHSGLWDSSGSQITWNSRRRSVGMSYTNDTMFSGNQQNLVQNEVYTNTGYFGVRNSYWREAIYNASNYNDPSTSPNKEHDVWELKIDVASISNAEIEIFEGTPQNPIVTSGTNGSTITEAGIYSFCLAALPFSDKYRGKHNNGGFTLSNTGMENAHYIDDQAFIDMMDAQLTLFNAKSIDDNIPAQITLNKVELRKAQADTTVVETPIMGSTFNYDVNTYEWNFLDVLDSEKVPIALNFSVGDISDISKRTSGYSKTFMIPASPHNNKIIDPMLAVNAERKKIGWERARIKSNGVVVFEGLMRIEEGNTGKGGFYKCHILEDTIDWSQEIADTKLCDLILNETTQPKRDYLNVLYSWFLSKPYGGVVEPITGFTLPEKPQGWFWGLANYGKWYYKNLIDAGYGGISEYAHSSKDFHPVVFTRSIVEAIFKSIGYSVESKFMESTTFNLLCHPFGSGEDYELANNFFGEEGDHYAKAEEAGRKRADQILGWSNFKSGGYVPPRGYDRTWYPSLIIQSDIGNHLTGNPSSKAYGSSSKGYVVPFAGNYQVVCKGIIDVSFCAGANGGYVKVYVTNNGTGNGFQANGGNQAPGIADHGEYPFYTSYPSMNCSAGDVISFKIVAETLMNGTFSTCKYWVAAKELEMLVYPIPSGGQPSIDVNKGKFLPCDTKQIDFLSGITDLFNLQWTADSQNKIVYFEPYDDFFGSGDVKDWTEKLDHTRWNDKFIVEELAKEVRFSYKRSTTDVGMTSLDAWRETNGLGEYKTHIEINDEKFRKEAVDIATNKFAPIWRFNNYGLQPNPNQNSDGHYNWGDLTWTNPSVNKKNPLMPVIWTESGGHINKKNRPPYKAFPKMKLQIVNYYSLLNGVQPDGSNPNNNISVHECSPYKFIDDNGAAHTHSVYPFMDWINGWKKGIEPDPYCLSWNDYDDGEFVSKGLFEKYWRVAYEKMNGGSVLRSAFINLTAVDIADFDYRDLIHITIDNVSTYWTVNKIIDYNPNKKQLTKVELLEWKQAPDFASSRKNSGSIMNEFSEKRIEQEEIAIKRNNDNGVTIENNSGNKASGTGVALGRGVVANNNQTVIGSYNDPNSTDVFQVGAGTSEDDRRTAFSISSRGEVKIGGGEIYVEEEDGTIHDLIVKKEATLEIDNNYTSDSSSIIENNNTDIQKLYLSKPKEYKIEENNTYKTIEKKTQEEFNDALKKQ